MPACTAAIFTMSYRKVLQCLHVTHSLGLAGMGGKQPILHINIAH